MIDISQESCSGCGSCVKVCPWGVIELKDKRAALVAEDDCIECGACQLNCHDDAIMVTKGVGCLIAIVRDDILKLGSPDAACG